MPVELYRVDNRLIHGQVLEAWVPRVHADAILVVDTAASKDPFQKSVLEAMGLDVLHVSVAEPKNAASLLEGEFKDRKVVVLFRTVEEALAAFRAGVAIDRLNLGNIHPGPECCSLTPSVNLNAGDIAMLKELMAAGVKLEARAVPCERTVDVGEFCKGAFGG